MNVVIGLDPHKASNTIAVLDRDENVLFRRRFVNSNAGFKELIEHTRVFPDRVWAVEGAAGMGRSIAQQLVAGGETVTDVPAKLAAQIRVYGTGHGRKTDTTDAISIAKAALRSKRVRPVTSDDGLVALKLLVDRRRELVGMRVQAMCRLHRLLRELIPGGAKLRSQTREAAELLENLDISGVAGSMRRRLALEHLAGGSDRRAHR